MSHTTTVSGSERRLRGITGDLSMRPLLIVGVVLSCSLFSGCASQATVYGSREAASEALIGALDPELDLTRLRAVMGDGVDELVTSGDAVRDREQIDRFVKEYRGRHGFEESDDGLTYLVLGEDDYPFAIPLTPAGGGWRWDVDAGREELLNRRIGANELDTIRVCLAVVDAQFEYASRDRDGDGLREYAKRFRSTPGSRDGLYWPTQPGETPSPLGVLAAEASDEGYTDESEPGVYHGYRYRMLTWQGESASGGARDYLVDGNMIGGFAVIAWPATYGNSGVMTFMVSQDGIVYDADLGASTDTLAREIEIFDPGEGWAPVNETPFEF
jgi:hypothetical protein